MSIAKNQTRKIELGPQFRAAKIDNSSIDVEARTVDVAFSSETEEVIRSFGREILDHSPDSVRLGRLTDGGAVLVDHDTRDHVGVVESVAVDTDRRGRAKLRFGQGVRATEIFQDVIDKIRQFVSVGYFLHEAERDESYTDTETYRIVDWEPYEISFVAVPADATAGVGRSNDEITTLNIIEHIKQENRTMSDSQDTATPAAEKKPEVNVTQVRSEGVEQERNRVNEINAIGDKYGMGDLARNFVDNGKSVEDFRTAALERFGGTKPVEAEAPDIGMSEREMDKFSFVRALNAMANPRDHKAQEAAAFEIECSRAAGDKMRKDVQGIMVPVDMLKRAMHEGMTRDLNVTTATAGGNVVATDLMSGSFIDMLSNKSMMMQPGMATVLKDLNGNLAIPRQTGGAAAYWVAESGAPTESEATFDQVTLSPKTVGAFTDFSRKLLLQSSIDVESFVRMDLARTLALEIDRAAIHGSGASNQPTGILNTTGIGAVAGGTNGLSPEWSHIVDLETAVAVDNADVGSLRYLTNAVVRGKLKQTEKVAATANFIWSEGNEMNGYEAMVTNQVPSDLTKGTSVGVCSAIMYGNFADFLIGMWGGLDLTVDPFTGSTSGTVRVVALQDVDMAARHGESFAAMQDALTA